MKMQMTKEINCVVSEKPGAAGIQGIRKMINFREAKEHLFY